MMAMQLRLEKEIYLLVSQEQSNPTERNTGVSILQSFSLPYFVYLPFCMRVTAQSKAKICTYVDQIVFDPCQILINVLIFFH